MRLKSHDFEAGAAVRGDGPARSLARVAALALALPFALPVALIAAADALCGPALATPSTAPDSATTAGIPALDYAFRFASAITPDPKDRAKAQQLAIDGFAAVGAWDEALQRADAVEGWRRGVVYADLAEGLARVGRRDEAKRLVGKAEAVRAGVDGWQNPRVASRIAAALAAIGETEQARAIAARVASEDPQQYGGATAAAEAAHLAASGDVDAALRQLKDLAGNNDLEVAWARAGAALAIGRRADAPAKSRAKALEEAKTAAGPLPLELRLQTLLGVASAYDDLDRRGDARATLKEAAGLVEALPADDAARVPFLIDLGAAWAAAGAPDRGREALAGAEPLVAKTLVIDQPGLLARLASGWRKIPDAAAARRLDTRALDAAAAMTISRPRALAVAAICRQWGADGVTLDAPTRARLDALLAGLGEPW